MTSRTGKQLFPVIILGMHRSGTSCLAGSLEEAGLYLGDVNREAQHNAKGNHENIHIMDLHEAVLTANNGGWDAPPEATIWSSEHKAQRDAIIATYPAGKPWAFKDPRTLLTLDGWLEVLPSARLVGTFRHPLAVARSLHARNGFPQEKSMALWAYYNRKLLRYQRRFGFDLVCFDWPDDRYHGKLAHIARSLNLIEPRHGFSFFESNLRRNSTPCDADLPEQVKDVYGSLEVMAA